MSWENGTLPDGLRLSPSTAVFLRNISPSDIRTWDENGSPVEDWPGWAHPLSEEFVAAFLDGLGLELPTPKLRCKGAVVSRIDPDNSLAQQFSPNT